MGRKIRNLIRPLMGPEAFARAMKHERSHNADPRYGRRIVSWRFEEGWCRCVPGYIGGASGGTEPERLVASNDFAWELGVHADRLLLECIDRELWRAITRANDSVGAQKFKP